MTNEIASPTSMRRRLDRLIDRRHDRQREVLKVQQEIANNDAYLSIADRVTTALELLSENLFKKLLGVVEQQITIALQEILDQPIKLCAIPDFERDTTTVTFEIDRNGNREDVLLGQGGSVANILSVGLRLFALATLPTKTHRGFLVLDEQDCWLRPELVPKLVKIVAQTSRTLGFQVLLISHHDVAIFERYADKIYRFIPMMGDVVQIQEISQPAVTEDRE